MNDGKDKRALSGKATSAIGIVCNLALAASKIAVGAAFGLVSVMADGFNNLSDSGSSAVSLVSFCVSDKPADKEHPYGHRRAEYIAAMVTGLLVLFLAAELFRESIEKTIAGESPESSWIVYLVLGISVAVKAGMFVFYRVTAKRLGSDALKAAATDSICDCAATAAVIIGIIILRCTGLPADGWAGIIVALFIVWQGLKILLDASSKLLGQAPDEALIKHIKDIILAGEGVLGMHDLQVYGYGKGVSFATAHIEMDASLPALVSHTAVDAIERKVKEETGVTLTAHLDPVDLGDVQARELESRVREAVTALGKGLEVHDFRLIRGTKNKAVFDVGAPYSCPDDNAALLTEIKDIVRSLGDYEPVITIDRE
ncbi:MAG TPA: cation diffusion facilitator family transporter [Candidatus Protoclostridium stercorigallinarum]|uniref:Cation diffusion facilitator family transporter n=1 Tax=Candidatus Protoclostridium stercorigallinarum TaxID=2838741 RepID=A0A9D1TR50_9FIRM|nr:cation diffusion facilitator family transporter [Candidatus Protoclostridium stercorigallinarum]